MSPVEKRQAQAMAQALGHKLEDVFNEVVGRAPYSTADVMLMTHAHVYACVAGLGAAIVSAGLQVPDAIKLFMDVFAVGIGGESYVEIRTTPADNEASHAQMKSEIDGIFAKKAGR